MAYRFQICKYTHVARYQQLSINPQKLAGQCGKLKCCLNYELDSYLDALSNFPSSSTTLDTEKGKAFCIKIDVFKKKMWFAYVDSSIAWYDFDIDLVKKLISKNKRGEKTPPLEDLKQPESPLQSIDLIQENNVDRFEKKNRGNRNRNNQNKPHNNQGQNQGQKKNRPDRQERPERSEKPENQNAHSGNQQKQQKPNPQQKAPVVKVETNNADGEKKPQNNNPNKKKFKKKYPPKKITMRKILGLFSLILFFSCTSSSPGEAVIMNSVDNKWNKKSEQKFNLEITDPQNSKNIIFVVRNNNNYPYSNIRFIVNFTNQQNKKKETDTLNYVLAKPNGEWLGTGFGDTKETLFQYRLKYRFPAKGKYEIGLIQAMRNDNLPGIEDIGVKIETAKP